MIDAHIYILHGDNDGSKTREEVVFSARTFVNKGQVIKSFPMTIINNALCRELKNMIDIVGGKTRTI